MAEPTLHPTDAAAQKQKKESFVVLIFSGIIIGFVGLALWLSVTSIFEKVRISRGLDQVITIVTVARDATRADPNFAVNDRKDLLAVLERNGRLQTDGTVDSVKILRNAWGNVVVALIDADGNVRVETIVPPHVCQRFIGSFGEDPQSFGVKKVEVKGYNNAWRQVYDMGAGGSISENSIVAACGGTVQTDVALTFTLH